MINPTDIWNSRYSQKYFVYGKKPNVFLKAFGKKLKPGKTLLLAEGEGRNAVYLAKHGHITTAWDISQAGLDKCRQLATEKKVTVKTELIDITQVRWQNGSWDNIIAIFAHFHREDRPGIFNGIKKSLKPGGTFLMEVYSTNQINYATGGPKITDLLYQPDELLSIFANWHIPHFYFGEVVRHEGKLHNGNGHVIQILTQKPKK